MKSKFTLIIMIIIIIVIIAAFGLLGLIVFKDITGVDLLKIGETEEVEEFNEDGFWDSQGNDDNTNYVSGELTEKTLDSLEIHKTPRTTTNQNSSFSDVDNNVNYDNLVVNKYFYKQLNKYSQVIYKAFESNKQQMKSGNHKINLGSAFSSVLSQSNGQDLLGDYYQSAIEAYLYDNPDVFYLNPSKMFLNIETTTKGTKKTYNVYINSGDSSSYLIDEFNSKDQVDMALSKIESVKNQIIRNKTGDTYQDIKMIHDYLIDNLEYDSSISAPNIYNIYGALVSKRCVCEGYAKAFKYLLDNVGIESTLVIGRGVNSSGKSENHAWNYVKINGNYYAVDCTWDDPIVIGGSATNRMKYKYFLKGQSEISNDHYPSGKFTEDGQEFNYPPLSYSSFQNR